MNLKKDLEGFMVRDLKNGVPTFTIEEFANKAGYSFKEFNENAKDINLSKIWDGAIGEAQEQMRTEMFDLTKREKEIDKKLNSFKLKIPFLYSEQKNNLMLEKELINGEKIDTGYSLSNSLGYYEDFKKQLNRFDRQNLIKNKTEDFKKGNMEIEQMQEKKISRNAKTTKKINKDFELEM